MAAAVKLGLGLSAVSYGVIGLRAPLARLIAIAGGFALILAPMALPWG